MVIKDNSDYSKKLNSNLCKYLLADVLLSIGTMFRGILFLFYAAIMLETYQFGILTGVLYLTTILFEVPSGIFADKYGRKKSMFIAGIFSLLALTIWLFAQEFILATIGTIFLGLYYSFRSGADQALIYDTHLQLKKQKEFKEYISKNFAYTMYSGGLASILAGYLLEVNFRLIFLICILFTTLAIITIASMEEPKIISIKKRKVYQHLILSLKTIISRKKIFWIFFYGAIITGIINGIYQFHAIFLSDTGFSPTQVGFFIGSMFFIAALTAHNFSFFHNRLKEEKLLVFSPIIVGSLYILIALSFSFSTSWLLLIEAFIAGLIWPCMDNLNNKYLPSKERATLLSVLGSITSFFLILVGLLVGFGAKFASLRTTYLFIGVVFALTEFFVASRLLNHIKRH